MDEKLVGLGILAALIISLAGMVYLGFGRDEKLIFPVVFSVALSAAVLFFSEWFEQEEK